MSDKRKVIIAGAGSGGLLVASKLAYFGFDVTVFESQDERTYRESHNWSDAVELDVLERAGMPVPEFGEKGAKDSCVRDGSGGGRLYEPRIIRNIAVYSPDYGFRTKTDIKAGYALIDRRMLRALQLKEALSAGARVIFATPAESLLGTVNCPLGDVSIQGVTAGGEEYYADLVIDAGGWRGALRGMIQCDALEVRERSGSKLETYRTVRRTAESGTALESFIDHYRIGAYRGYFWVRFLDDGIVEIGGRLPFGSGVREKVRELARRFPNVGEEELRGGEDALYINESPSSLVASGFMLVGESAAQVDPNGSCAVGASLMGALDAVDCVKKAKDFSIESLWPYNVGWHRGRGAHYAALNAVRLNFHNLSHDDVGLLIRCAVYTGEHLTGVFNGEFSPPARTETLRSLGLALLRPSLQSIVSKASASGAKRFNHFMSFPEIWDEKQFDDWRNE